MSSVINWMGGWPKEGLVSGADWEERLAVAAANAAIDERAAGASDQARRNGDAKLRNQLANGLLSGKTGRDERYLVLTSGADEALALIMDKTAAPGDVVLVERLTSRSALQAFRKAGLQTAAVEGDRHGMDPEALTTALYRYRPKMVYVSLSCTDPEGAVWSEERKQAARQRCQEAGVLLVSDDRQEMLLYDYDASRQRKAEHGMLSIGQLPPGLVAGLRLGWIAGSVECLRAYIRKLGGDHLVPIPAVEQRALSDLIEEQPLEPLVEMLRVQCRERMKKMTELLGGKHMPDLTWIVPKGGLHLWVILPSGLDGESLLRGAWLKGLIFQPGGPFYAKDPQANTLRLTHAFADERQLKLGVARLAESIEEFTGRWSMS